MKKITRIIGATVLMGAAALLGRRFRPQIKKQLLKHDRTIETVSKVAKTASVVYKHAVSDKGNIVDIPITVAKFGYDWMLTPDPGTLASIKSTEPETTVFDVFAEISRVNSFKFEDTTMKVISGGFILCPQDMKGYHFFNYEGWRDDGRKPWGLNDVFPKGKYTTFEVLCDEDNLIIMLAERTLFATKLPGDAQKNCMKALMPKHLKFVCDPESSLRIVMPNLSSVCKPIKDQSKFFDHWDERMKSSFKCVIQGDTGSGKTQAINIYLRSRGYKTLSLTPESFDDIRLIDEFIEDRVIIIDDFDRVAHKASITRILTWLDEVKARIFITCNDIGNLPRALRRPGRIDQVIMWPKISEQGVIELVERCLGEDVSGHNLDRIMQVSTTSGLAGVVGIIKLFMNQGGQLTLPDEDVTFDQPPSYDEPYQVIYPREDYAAADELAKQFTDRKLLGKVKSYSAVRLDGDSLTTKVRGAMWGKQDG